MYVTKPSGSLSKLGSMQRKAKMRARRRKTPVRSKKGAGPTCVIVKLVVSDGKLEDHAPFRQAHEEPPMLFGRANARGFGGQPGRVEAL